MKLFSKEIDKKLFSQYSKGSDLDNQVVVTKIFNPYGNGRWFLLNSDPQDQDYLWAIVQMGDVVEMGSVLRSELESVRVSPFRFPLERDLSFRMVNAGELFRGLQEGKFYKKGGWVNGYANGGEIKIGQKVKAKESYGGEYGIVEDITNNFVVVKTKDGSKSFHISDLQVIENEEDENDYADGGELELKKQHLLQYLNWFPYNAKSWGQASDEVRDIARMARMTYLEVDEKEYPALDFKTLKTPSEWNTQGRFYITDMYFKMSEKAKKEFLDNFQETFSRKMKHGGNVNEGKILFTINDDKIDELLTSSNLSYEFMDDDGYLLSEKDFEKFKVMVSDKGYNDDNIFVSDYNYAKGGQVGLKDAKISMSLAFDNAGFSKAFKGLKKISNKVYLLQVSSYIKDNDTLQKIINEFNETFKSNYVIDKDSFKKTFNGNEIKLENKTTMANGGEVNSIDSLYYLQVIKDDKEVAREKFRAKNLKEAKEISEEEYESNYISKYGNPLNFIVSEAMANGGEVEEKSRIKNISDIKIGQNVYLVDKYDTTLQEYKVVGGDFNGFVKFAWPISGNIAKDVPLPNVTVKYSDNENKDTNWELKTLLNENIFFNNKNEAKKYLKDLAKLIYERSIERISEYADGGELDIEGKRLADNPNWTNEKLKVEYDSLKKYLQNFNSGLLKPSKVIGTGYKSSAIAKRLAKEWLEKNVAQYKKALEIRGVMAKGGKVKFADKVKEVKASPIET